MTPLASVYCYRIVTDHDDHGQRITAISNEGVEIAGAYRPGGLNDWRVYVTKLVADATGLPQPHKVHACSRQDALRWVGLLAALYGRGAL